MSQERDVTTRRHAPFADVRGIEDPDLVTIPDLEQFQELAAGETVIRSYDIRVRKPNFPWLQLIVSIPTLLGPFLVLWWYSAGEQRGHTFLYLTDRRVIIVEQERGLLERHQTVLNYNNDDVAGFQVFTQRGAWKLLDIIKLRDKRTFYISLLTGGAAGFTLGALSSVNSHYDPGKDAVALCAELDSTLLAIKSGADLA